MSCLEKPLKPIKPIKKLDIILRRRYVPDTQHYFTNRKHAAGMAAGKEGSEKPGRPFRVPRSENLLPYIKYSDRKDKVMARDRLSLPLHKKDNFKVAATRDISQRLFVEEPPNDVKTVLEIHPEFYSVIEGRPLRSLDDINKYVNNIRTNAMNKQQIGYRWDLILQFDKDIAEENKEHDQIAKILKQHIKNFQHLLTEDYKKACSKVTKAERIREELVSKNNELLGYVSQLTLMNNVIFKLDAIRNVLKIYRQYLLFVAPLPWRQQYDETLTGKLQSIQFETGEFATDDDFVESMDIEKMVEQAKIELSKPLPAHMYFKDPSQMMHFFRTIELQSREYLIQLSKFDAPFYQLQQRIKQLNLSTKQEQDYFEYYIFTIEKAIEREEYNEKYFQEKFYRILNETFFECAASPPTLKLKICIEYVYERILGKCEEGHQTLMAPMKILECLYEEYNLQLDSLDFKIVKQAQSDCFAQDLKMLKNAYQAERELKSFKEMTDAMKRAFLPPKQYTRPKIRKFIEVKNEKKQSLLAERRKKKMESGESTRQKRTYKLSPEEKDGLEFFTDWCEGINPEPYLSDYYTYVKPTFDCAPINPATPSNV